MSLRITTDRIRTAEGVVGDTILVEEGVVRWVGFDDSGDVRTPGTIVPALRDAHLHPSMYAATVAGADLRTVADPATLRERLAEEAAGLAERTPLVARGFDHEQMDGWLPTATDLDLVDADRPILLYRKCGHLAVANTAALSVAGIGAATPDPPGGSLDRDGSGGPTGVLRETAIELVAGPLGGAAAPMTVRDLERAMDDLAGRGLSEIHAMIAPDSSMWCGPRDEMAMLSQIELPVRVEVFAITDRPDTLDRIRSETSGDLRFGGWKGFADGALGARTAALSEPYADGTGTGTARWDVGSHRACAERALELGGSVAVHAIGDNAVDRVLDLFAELCAAGADPASLRIEHVSVIRPESLARMAELGVIGSVQPAFVRSDGPWIPDRLGPGRLGWAHPFRSMADAGVPLLGGSDAPVEVPDPWQGMADARQRPFLPPDEALDAERAFSMYVPPGALAPGSPADLLVLDRDPVDTDDPAGTTILARYRRGRPA